MKNILVDCDGVLLHWIEGFSLFLKHTHNIHVHVDDHDAWELHDWVGKSPEETQNLILQFNTEAWEFGCIPVYDNSTKAIKELKEAGFNLSVITACAESEQTIALRKANLFHVYGDVFDDVHTIGFNESKKPLLEMYEPSWWIEDKVSNAEDGLEFKHKSIVLEHNHNQMFRDNSDPRLVWKKNWQEVVSHIKEN